MHNNLTIKPKSILSISLRNHIKDRYRKTIALCDESLADVIIFKLRSDRLSVRKLQIAGRLKSDKRLSGAQYRYAKCFRANNLKYRKGIYFLVLIMWAPFDFHYNEVTHVTYNVDCALDVTLTFFLKDLSPYSNV